MAITTNNLISKQTVGSAGAASITFSNIPQGFTDLRIVVSGRSVRSAVNDVLYMTVNGSATTYSSKILEGSGAAASSSSGGSTAFSDILGIPAASSTASVFSNAEIYIPNYTSANYKSISASSVGENNATTAYTDLYAGLWSNTAAITSITLYNTISNFVEYSTFSLYGISSNTSTQNTSVPSATGGDVITTDGTYWYHAFKYSGTFTPLKALTADCLVVAGGGGSSDEGYSGGGAGGYLTFNSQSFSSNQTVTVGAGGANSPTLGTNGNDSQIGSLTLVKGGGGGGAQSSPTGGANGGSGGGGGASASAVRSGGTATSGQGNDGGSNGTFASPYPGGGGGGAGAAGTVGGVSFGGNGGNGLYTAISGGATTGAGQLSGGNYYFAGGGSAGGYNAATPGTSGLGGGGTTPSSGTGTSGTANTGGGGGAGNLNAVTHTAGSGGSGIVIVRYAV